MSLQHIDNYDAYLAARYGIVETVKLPADHFVAKLGIATLSPGAVTVRSKGKVLTNQDKRRICRHACARIGARRPRFNSTRTALYESTLSRSARSA